MFPLSSFRKDSPIVRIKLEGEEMKDFPTPMMKDNHDFDEEDSEEDSEEFIDACREV